MAAKQRNDGVESTPNGAKGAFSSTTKARFSEMQSIQIGEMGLEAEETLRRHKKSKNSVAKQPSKK